jgi:hypothetical protein
MPAMVLVFLAFAASVPLASIPPSVHAGLTNTTFIPKSIAQSVQDGVFGVNVTWTNPQPTRFGNVWFVAYDSGKNQVVLVAFVGLNFPGGGSNTVFVGLSSALLSGTYTVHTFIVSRAGTVMSPDISLQVSF